MLTATSTEWACPPGYAFRSCPRPRGRAAAARKCGEGVLNGEPYVDYAYFVGTRRVMRRVYGRGRRARWVKLVEVDAQETFEWA